MDDFERCAVCKALTHVSKSIPLAERELYFDGIGQLCFDCYKELLLSDDHPDELLMQRLTRVALDISAQKKHGDIEQCGDSGEVSFPDC